MCASLHREGHESPSGAEYSYRRSREDSVVDSLWNRFFDHVYADGFSDEGIARENIGQGTLVQVISAMKWWSEFVNDPSRIVSLLNS